MLNFGLKSKQVVSNSKFKIKNSKFLFAFSTHGPVSLTVASPVSDQRWMLMRIALFSETFLPKIDGIVKVVCLTLEHFQRRGRGSRGRGPRSRGERIRGCAGDRRARHPGPVLPGAAPGAAHAQYLPQDQNLPAGHHPHHPPGDRRAGRDPHGQAAARPDRIVLPHRPDAHVALLRAGPPGTGRLAPDAHDLQLGGRDPGPVEADPAGDAGQWPARRGPVAAWRGRRGFPSPLPG